MRSKYIQNIHEEETHTELFTMKTASGFGGGDYLMLVGGDVPSDPLKRGPEFWQRPIQNHTHNSGVM